MAWVLLLLAGLGEVVWATALKLSDGLSRPLAALVVFAAAGAVLVGALWLGEALTPLRVASTGLILLGIVGLRLSQGAA